MSIRDENSLHPSSRKLLIFLGLMASTLLRAKYLTSVSKYMYYNRQSRPGQKLQKCRHSKR